MATKTAVLDAKKSTLREKGVSCPQFSDRSTFWVETFGLWKIVFMMEASVV